MCRDPALDTRTHLADHILLLMLCCFSLVPVRISGRLAIITDVLVFFLSCYTLIWQTAFYYCCGVITLFFYTQTADRMLLLKILYAFLKYQLNKYGAASCYIRYD